MESRLCRIELDRTGNGEAGIPKIVRVELRLRDQVIGLGVARILFHSLGKKIGRAIPALFFQGQNTKISFSIGAISFTEAFMTR